MNSSLQIAWLAGTLGAFVGCASASTGPEVAPEQTLSVRVYNAAGIPAATLNSAIAETVRLFQPAGIRLTWEQVSNESPEDSGTDMTAAAFHQPDSRPYLFIRLSRGTPGTVFPRALGYSLPFAHHGAHVVIFYDRIEALRTSVNTAAYVVLGHVMAHEMGHVLLGSTEHTSGGLMQASWTPASWRLASAGLIVFDRAEIKRIRAGLSNFRVVERVTPHEPTPPAGTPTSNNQANYQTASAIR